MAETAGIYCRLSLAAMGDTTKVDDQERICRELAAQRGWAVPDEFVWKDNNKSAWRIGVRRPQWEAMLETVRIGQLKNLIVYHGDRMVRQPYDLEVLIRLANGGVTITSPTGTRRLDVAEDVFVLAILANVARLESENISRRKKQGFDRMARAGEAPVPGGRFGRGFGYERDGRTPVPAEAAAVRETAARVLGGEPLTAIAADLTRRGIMGVSGKPLNYQSLKRILSRPRTAGLVAGARPGTWEALLDRQTWEAVQAALRDREPVRTPAAPRWLLSGIATCGACGGRMQVHYTGRKGHVTAGYGCPSCRKVHRSMPLLDAYVTGVTVRRLSHPRNPAGQIPAAPGLAAQFAALAAQRGETEAAIADPARGGSLRLLLDRLDGIDQRLAELRGLAAGDARQRLLAGHEGITSDAFSQLPLAVRRALVAACFHVTVLPASGRGPGFRVQDVELRIR
jgi:site-specific DNA recombinase